jgi:fructose-specific phosphotransferase system IIC component
MGYLFTPVGLADGPTPKDVVVATVGASAALGGLVLVFLGLVVSAYQSYPRDTPASVREARRRAIWPVLGVFAVCMLSLALGFVWLEEGRDSWLYAASNVVFAAELVAIVVVAAYTVRGMVS